VWEKVRGVFLMPSNRKNATNFFPYLIYTEKKLIKYNIILIYIYIFSNTNLTLTNKYLFNKKKIKLNQIIESCQMDIYLFKYLVSI